MSITRWLPVAVCSIVLGGCGYADAGQGPPDVQLGPSTLVSFRFHNATGNALYVDWAHARAHFEVERDGVEVGTDPQCVPVCGNGCACYPCAEPTPSMLQIAAGERLAIDWMPTRFHEQPCGTERDCRCVEQWPLTAGKYEIRLQAWTAVEGGNASEGNPSWLLGAVPSPQATSCPASLTFQLGLEDQCAAPFRCP